MDHGEPFPKKETAKPEDSSCNIRQAPEASQALHETLNRATTG